MTSSQTGEQADTIRHVTRRARSAGRRRGTWMSSGALLLALAASLLPFSPAQAAPCDQHAQGRPSVGLALSGGGARGAAHIGVIKVLEELKIPIDCIAGTSMGSIIGGLYASGLSTADLERAIADIPWDDVFHDQAERAERSFRRKTDDLLFLVKGKVRIKDGEPSIGSALVQGQKFDLVLTELTLPVRDVTDFDALRIPFRAVATDIVTGDEVVLSHGLLPKALRASMAVPAAFAAVEIDDRLLVDGGISNNLPISVVRDMGADIIIAVDISTPLRTREQLDSSLEVLSQLSGLLTQRNVKQQLATLTQRDVLVVPPLGDFSSGDFERIQRAVPIGEAGAREALAALERYAVSAPEYARYVASLGTAEREAPAQVVDFIEIENNSQVSDETIAAHLAYPTGKPLDVNALEEGIARVYGMDIFEIVQYRVVEKEGRTGVVVSARERSWGTDSLQAGLQLGADLDGNSSFDLGLAYTMMPINSLNGEWRSILNVGDEPAVFTEIYQPLDPAERWFVDAKLGWQSRNVTLYDDDSALARYRVREYGFAVGGGYNIGTWGRLQANWWRLWGDADARIGASPDPISDFDVGELRMAAALDTLDNLYFPRFGMTALAGWKASRDWLGADGDFDQYRFVIGGANSWGEHTVLARARYRTTADDDAPIHSLFRTGGFLNLSGFQEGELSGQHAANLLGGYMYRITEKFVPTYAGLSLEAGNVWQDRSDVALDDLLLAGSVFLGADTPLGPVYLAVGKAEGGHSAFYLYLGQPWFGD